MNCHAFIYGLLKTARLALPGIKTPLQPHQESVVRKILGGDLGQILAHDVGSGKTLSSLAAANAIGQPATVLLPASLIANYRKEMAKHLTDKSVPFELLSQQAVARDPSLLQPGHTLIVDEAHRLRNEQSKIFDAVANTPFAKKILLTGTPTYNSPKDIINLLGLVDPPKLPPKGQGHSIDDPGVLHWNMLHGAKKFYQRTLNDYLEKGLGSAAAVRGEFDAHLPVHWATIRKYMKQVKDDIRHGKDVGADLPLDWQAGGRTDLITRYPWFSNRGPIQAVAKYRFLQDKIKELTKDYEVRDNKYSRFLTDKMSKFVDYYRPDTTADFPERSDATVPVPMAADQAAEYQKYFRQLPANLRFKILENTDGKLPPSAMQNPFLVKTRQLQNIHGESAPKLDQMLADLQASPGKTVAYSNFLEHGLEPYRQRLESAGVPYGMFTGTMTPREKQQSVADYNADRIKALLVSSAGGEGLDLKGTRLMQIMEPHWNDEKINQVIGRAIRYKSHAGLPAHERHVQVNQYESTIPGTAVPTTESYMKTLANYKKVLNDKVKALGQPEL